MFRKIFLVTVVAAIAMASGVAAYGQDAGALAMALDKNKYKNKQKSKNGVDVSVETYLDLKHVPVVKAPAGYSGRYADEYGGFSLDLKVASDGAAEGRGVDTANGDVNASKMSFTLKNARVNGAVLTADKVFANGTTERLEAVFVNRTTATGKNEKEIATRDTQFGLGFVQKNEQWTNRVFLIAK